MQYQAYPVANFQTGFDRERQPPLLPVDAQTELLDGYVYKGVWQKREGYSQYATGQRGSAPYTESRMVHTISGFATVGAINAVNTVFTASLTVPVGQRIRRGGVTVVGTVPVQSFSDNGLGGFTGATGTINYETGAMSITLPVAPTAGSVTVTYSLHQGLPVMGIMNFVTQNNTQQLIVADTRYVNRYNPTTNRLDDISPAVLLTGDETNFMSWTNYPTPADEQRLLFVNNKDPIHQYLGGAVTPFPVFTASSIIASIATGVVGNGTTGPYTLTTPAGTGIMPGTLTINEPISAQTVTDNGSGILTGDGTGTVNYLTGVAVVTFNVLIVAANPINWAYTQLNTPIDTCLHIRNFKDRLVIFNTLENGIRYGLRIRISGFGQFGDIFVPNSAALGAGVIDVPDRNFITSLDYNRDDIIFFTQSTWALFFTGSDIEPFGLRQIDNTRGSQAPYGTITYLNQTSAASTRGLIYTDGYSVARADEKLPDYSFNFIDQSRFGLCFAGAVDEDRDHYLIHPSPGENISDVILVTNYEEYNYSVYRIPLSGMGNFEGQFDVVWNDLLIYNTWDELAAVYGDWQQFSYDAGAPFAIGGGHEGQIFKLNVTESEDYPVKIRGATVIDGTTLRVTTDFQNYKVGDYVVLEGMIGLTEANDKQAAIKSIQTANYVFDLEIQTAQFSNALNPYVSGGVASKAIIFSTRTKQFNPFAEQAQKVRCGWIYFYVSRAGTDLTSNKYITAITNDDPCVVTVPGHGYSTGNQVFIDGVLGMTELNGLYFYITVIDSNTFSLDGVNSTAYGIYTSRGFTSTPDDAKLLVETISNDKVQVNQVLQYNPQPYAINLSTFEGTFGVKKWYKMWVNQTAQYLQFRFYNQQAGAAVQIHAFVPGFAGVGRLL